MRKHTSLCTNLRSNPSILLASCVNTPIDHNVFHNLPAPCCEVLCVLCELGLTVRIWVTGGGDGSAEAGKESSRPPGESGGARGETKPTPTLPVTPPAGFKLMQDPFTGQLFIIPGTSLHSVLCLYTRSVTKIANLTLRVVFSAVRALEGPLFGGPIMHRKIIIP